MAGFLTTTSFLSYSLYIRFKNHECYTLLSFVWFFYFPICSKYLSCCSLFISIFINKTVTLSSNNFLLCFFFVVFLYIFQPVPYVQCHETANTHFIYLNRNNFRLWRSLENLHFPRHGCKTKQTRNTFFVSQSWPRQHFYFLCPPSVQMCIYILHLHTSVKNRIKKRRGSVCGNIITLSEICGYMVFWHVSNVKVVPYLWCLMYFRMFGEIYVFCKMNVKKCNGL